MDYITARDGEERELLCFLNKVFYRNRLMPIFQGLLPKLYKARYHPCRHNLIVREGGQLRAAVGLFPMEFCAGGQALQAAGIGNVAVGKPWRGRGYMKLLMRQALELSRERGTDFLVLAGQRQRYQYFGFENVGGAAAFKVSKTNLRHACLGKTNLTARRLRRSDAESLAAIHALNETAPLHCKRDPAALWDTLRSWFAVPYVLREGGAFAGYFVFSRIGQSVGELRLAAPHTLGGAVPAILAGLKRSRLTFSVLPAEAEAAAFFGGLCETMRLSCPNHFHVMHYERVLRAFLRLRAQIGPLCEGELVLRINGFLAPETLWIRVRGGEIDVETTDAVPTVTLEHLEAMRCFFAPLSPERAALPAFAAAWFPLPLEYPYIDTV